MKLLLKGDLRSIFINLNTNFMQQQYPYLKQQIPSMYPLVRSTKRGLSSKKTRYSIWVFLLLWLPFLGNTQTYRTIDFSDGTSSINGAATNPSSTTDYVATIGGDTCPLSGDFLNGYDTHGGQSMLTFTFNTPVNLSVSNFIYLDYYFFNDIQNDALLSRYLAVQDLILFTSAGNLTGSVTFTDAIDSALNNQEWVRLRIQVPYTATNTITITGLRIDIEMINGGTGGAFNTSGSEVFALALEGIGSDILLPVEFLNFDASLKGSNDVQLNWTTASELNNAGFEIEHALPTTDAPEFNQVAYVDGAGTTEQTQYYHYKLSNLVAGIHYFRLKQVDKDGTSTYSPIRAVQIEAPLVKQLFPTIVTKEQPVLHIQLAEGGTYQVKLLSTLGQVLETHKFSLETSAYYELAMESEHYTSGVYLVQVSNGLSSYTRKIQLK